MILVARCYIWKGSQYEFIHPHNATNRWHDLHLLSKHLWTVNTSKSTVTSSQVNNLSVSYIVLWRVAAQDAWFDLITWRKYDTWGRFGWHDTKMDVIFCKIIVWSLLTLEVSTVQFSRSKICIGVHRKRNGISAYCLDFIKSYYAYSQYWPDVKNPVSQALLLRLLTITLTWR